MIAIGSPGQLEAHLLLDGCSKFQAAIEVGAVGPLRPAVILTGSLGQVLHDSFRRLCLAGTRLTADEDCLPLVVYHHGRKSLHQPYASEFVQGRPLSKPGKIGGI